MADIHEIESLPQIAAWMSSIDLLPDHAKQAILRLVKRIGGIRTDDINLSLAEWSPIAMDAAWWEAECARVASEVERARDAFFNRSTFGVKAKSKWELEQILSSSAHAGEWDRLQAATEAATKLQRFTERLSSIARDGLKVMIQELSINQRRDRVQDEHQG